MYREPDSVVPLDVTVPPPQEFVLREEKIIEAARAINVYNNLWIEIMIKHSLWGREVVKSHLLESLRMSEDSQDLILIEESIKSSIPSMFLVRKNTHSCTHTRTRVSHAHTQVE